jgi:hydrogenase maturation protein HypF
MCGHEVILRRARGYAPWTVPTGKQLDSVLAVGAHLKNTVALTSESGVVMSPHIGDLGTAEACNTFETTIASLAGLYGSQPARVACDMHPDYASTRFAINSGLTVVPVQHHHAHVLSCMADNELNGAALGVAWDGSGYGCDGTIWGGEFLQIDGNSSRRVAHLRAFPLPGGESAIRNPRRTAIGLLHEIFGDDVFTAVELLPVRSCNPTELDTLRAMLGRQFRSPLCSSAGRLFDAVASLVGVCHAISFEGQAAMQLEFASTGAESDESYNFELRDSVLNWEPMIRGIIADVQGQMNVTAVAAKFHNTLAEMILRVAMRTGEERVVMSGGCFQNKYLVERSWALLGRHGFRVYTHRRIPPNDGGISLGQAVAASPSPFGN